MKATANPAQYGLSQSIHKAIPKAITMARLILIASLVRVDKGIKVSSQL
jgi:hypothetical protein